MASVVEVLATNKKKTSPTTPKIECRLNPIQGMPTPLFMVLTPEHWKAWEFYKNTTRVRLLPTEWFAKFYPDDYNKWISGHWRQVPAAPS